MQIEIDLTKAAGMLLAILVLAGGAYAATEHEASTSNGGVELQLEKGMHNYTIEVGGQLSSDQYTPLAQLQNRRLAQIVSVRTFNKSHARLEIAASRNITRTVYIIGVKR